MALKERIPTQVLGHEEVQRKLQRIAHQLHEENFQEQEIVFVGVMNRGVDLANRLSAMVSAFNTIETQVVQLTIDKDDPLKAPPALSQELESLTNKVVVLVDDVLQSGRTLMIAAAHLVEVPLSKLTTVVLVDRRHRSYPIRADIVGLTLSTTLQEHISVRLGAKDAVYLD